MKGLAVLAGVIGSVISIGTRYSERAPVIGTGAALSSAFLGYEPGGTNTARDVATRLATSYGPVTGGIVIHKAAGRLGVNRSLPKGINL